MLLHIQLAYFGCLFLEGIEYSINKLLLKPGINVCGPHTPHDLLNALHHHLTVLFILVFQVINQS